jgi:hypothetical protein
LEKGIQNNIRIMDYENTIYVFSLAALCEKLRDRLLLKQRQPLETIPLNPGTTPSKKDPSSKYT